MKGAELRLVEYMEGSKKRFVIPVYQRTYTWNPQKETARFMNDLEDLIEKAEAK